MTSLVFQVESYFGMIEEAKLLLRDHADELAADKDMALEPDFDMYARGAQDGTLHVTTVREDGRLVGYHAAFTVAHPHHKNSLTAYVELYYLKPEYRMGWHGVKFMRFAETSLAELGVKRVFTTTTLDADKSVLLKWLGHKEHERIYVKTLGEKT